MLRCQWFESDGDVTICSGTPVSTIATSTTPMALVGSEGEETTIIEPGLTPDQTPTVQGDSSAATSLAPCPLLPTPSVPKVPSSSDSTALSSAVAGSMTVSPPLVFDSQLQATVSASASTPAANDVNSTSGLIDANASSFTPPPAALDLASSVAPVVNSPSFPVNDASSPNPPAPVVNSAPVSVNSHETDMKANSMDVDSDVNDEKAARSVVPAYDKSVLPAWLIKNGMLDYLHGISQEKAWQDLITTLVRFEIVNTMTGVSTHLFIALFSLKIVP